MLQTVKTSVLLELAEDFYSWECIMWEWTFLILQYFYQ